MEFKPSENLMLKNEVLITTRASDRLREFGFSDNELDKISQDVAELKEGYENPAERVKLLLKNPIYVDKNGDLMVPYWLESATRPQGGDCVDLAEDLMFKWQIESFVEDVQAKGCDILFCQGTGPDFFQNEGTNHIFLAIGKSKDNDRNTFVESDLAIVDPSLQIVDTPEVAKYHIRQAGLNLTTLTNRLHKPIKPVVIPDHSDGNLKISFNKDHRLIIGLDPERSFALFLSIGKFHDQYHPFISICDKNARDGVIMIYPKSKRIFDTMSNLKGVTQENKKYLYGLVHELQKAKFVKAKYEDGQPIDTNGVPLTGEFYKSVK